MAALQSAFAHAPVDRKGIERPDPGETGWPLVRDEGDVPWEAVLAWDGRSASHEAPRTWEMDWPTSGDAAPARERYDGSTPCEAAGGRIGVELLVPERRWSRMVELPAVPEPDRSWELIEPLRADDMAWIGGVLSAISAELGRRGMDVSALAELGWAWIGVSLSTPGKAALANVGIDLYVFAEIGDEAVPSRRFWSLPPVFAALSASGAALRKSRWPATISACTPPVRGAGSDNTIRLSI